MEFHPNRVHVYERGRAAWQVEDLTPPKAAEAAAIARGDSQWVAITNGDGSPDGGHAYYSDRLFDGPVLYQPCEVPE